MKVSDLSYDEAWLNLFSQAPQTFSIWTQSVECYKCDLEHKLSVFAYDNASLVINTAHNVLFELRNASNVPVCSKLLSLKEHGVYLMNITRKQVCPSLVATNNPDQIYDPLFVVFGVYFGSLFAWSAGKSLYRSQWLSKFFHNNPVIAEIENDLGSPHSSNDSATLLRYSSSPPTTPNRETPPNAARLRVQSLDVLRGVAICLMIFVNYGGGKYSLFEHSAWNGVTIADFVFPWFVWIMGVSLTFSLCSHLRSGSSRPQLFFSVLCRSVTLILIGLVISNKNNTDLSRIRIPGVLQRLGVSYFFVASVETFLMRTQPMFTYDAHGHLFHIRDLIESWPQWMFTLVVALIHSLVTLYLPVPGCPTGYLGAGGKADHGRYPNCTGGAAGYVDRVVFGEDHIYQNPPCKDIYATTVPFDPEGLLGTLTTIVLMYLGVYAGRVMLCFPKTDARVKRWLVSGSLFCLIGGLLCKFSQEGGMIPLNKNLWSLSFVLVTAGSSSILLAVFLLLVDHWKFWSGTPFHQAGRNAILLYICHTFTRSTFPWAWQVTHSHTHFEFTLMNVWGSCLWLLIALSLYERKFFLSV